MQAAAGNGIAEERDEQSERSSRRHRWPRPRRDGGSWRDDAAAVDYGRQLVAETYALIGPEVADPAMRYAGNNLACQDCHIDGGTRGHGLALVGRLGEVSEAAARRRHGDRSPTG